MADKKVILEVEIIEGNAQSTLNELNTSLKSLDKTHKDYAPTLKLIAQAERDLSKAQQKRILVEKGLTNSTIKVEKATKKTAKEMKQLSTHTGASTSASLELGRVFSDAPYGIRGVANNIQQLASNLFFMSKKTVEATGKTVGFGGALKQLGTGLWGATGVLVAFQAGIALLDYFKVGMSSAGSSAGDFKESIEDLTKTIDELNLSQDEAISKTKEYIEFKVLSVRLNKEIADSTEKMADLDDDIADKKAYILKREKQLYGELTKAQYHALSEEEKIAVKKKAQGALTENSEEALAKKIRETSDLEKDRLDLYQSTSKLVKELRDNKDELTDADKDSLKGLKKLKRERIEEREVLSKNSQKYKELTIAIDDYQKKIEEIEGKKLKKSSKVSEDKKISPFKTPKELELDVKNNEKVLINFNKKLEEYSLKTEMNNKLSASKSEEERFDIKKLYATKLLTSQINAERETLKLNKTTELEIAKSKTDAHVADIKRVFQLFKLKTELNDKLTSKQKESLIGDATGKMFDAIGQAGAEGEETADAIRERYKPILKVFEEVKDARFASLFSMFKGKGDNEKQENDLDKLKGYAEKAKEIIGGMGDFANAEFDRELTIEQNKTNALNNELNKRLQNENLSKEQRQAIQNQIAQNDEKLRIKQEQIERKRFTMQKAVNIAQATMDTFVAATGVLADTKGGSFARIAGMVATIGAGLAQVAMISRQKFQTSAGSSPRQATGSGSGGGGRAEPSFNIVGRSNDNILLSAIQSQFDQPLRAYVVARDVTNQQQLDGVISTSAST